MGNEVKKGTTGIKKAPGMKPGALTVFRVYRWLKVTFRKATDLVRYPLDYLS